MKKSVNAINKMAKCQIVSSYSIPQLPWAKVMSFPNSKQCHYPNFLSNAIETIDFMERNNIPFFLINNDTTPKYHTYDIYVDSSKTSKLDFLIIIESILSPEYRNDIMRKNNANLFYKEFNKIYN